MANTNKSTKERDNDIATAAFEKMYADTNIQPGRHTQGKSLRDFVRNSAAKILEAYDKGYTLDQIASALKSDNINISPRTLRQYLSEIGCGLRAKKRQKQQRKKQNTDIPVAAKSQTKNHNKPSTTTVTAQATTATETATDPATTPTVPTQPFGRAGAGAPGQMQIKQDSLNF